MLPALLAPSAAAGEPAKKVVLSADVEGGVWDVVWTLPLLPSEGVLLPPEGVERCVMVWSFIDPGHAQQGLSGKRQARGSLKGRALQGTQLRFLASWLTTQDSRVEVKSKR